MFEHTLVRCLLLDVGFAGPLFTWCNNQHGGGRIFACLDRCLLCVRGSDFNAKVRHLSHISSDHAPLLVDFYQDNAFGAKSFKFIDVWLQYFDNT